MKCPIHLAICLLLIGGTTIATADASVKPSIIESCDDDEQDDGNAHHVLSLVLDKPLGLLVESPYSNARGIGSGAIVSSLLQQEGKRGSAHKLPRDVREQLVGSRIIAINNKNTTVLPLSQVTKLIAQAESPVRVDFDLDEEENEEQEDEDHEIVGYAPHLQDEVVVGQVSPMRWEDTGEVIDSRASRVGLPKQLLPTIQSFVKQVRLAEMLKAMLYTNPCGGRQGRFYRSNSTDDEELLWYAQRPYLPTNWDADLHYFSPADEKTYESVLATLFRGGFGTVVEAIGTHFNLDSLAVQGIGFLGVTHCTDGSIHRDFQKLGGKAFNLLLPVHSVEGSGPELTVAGWKSEPSNKTANEENDDDYENDDDNQEFMGTTIKYNDTQNIGMLMGDTTWHGTRECDNRPMKDARIMMNIFLVDITEANVEPIAADMIDIFPVPGMTEWLWAQRGRHWRNGMCVDGDPGRMPFQPRDQRFDCPFRAKLGECESLPYPMRLECPVSCKVFVNGDE